MSKRIEPEVFAIHGATPEVLAYAMARYSRSSLSMRQALDEISEQKAADFLNTFYFQYGHKSIADMAHVPLAIERISLLAAIDVVDEQRWDGQERSTRYQDFSKREYYIPPDMDDFQAVHYHRSMNALFDAYEEVFKEAVEYFTTAYPKPEDMTEAAYNRTLKARAFDVARNLLPLGTLTSVGQVTSARALESQISRLLSSPHAEVRDIAVRMRDAVTERFTYNPEHARLRDALESVQKDVPSDRLEILEGDVVREVQAAPTLVKYAEASEYIAKTRELAKEAIQELKDILDPIPPDTGVKIFGVQDPEIEVVATLLYENSSYSFGDLVNVLRSVISGGYRRELLKKFLDLRGKHDDLPRAFRSKSGYTFDIVMDIGGMRDMHRHRRTNQSLQAFDVNLGFAEPDPSCTPRLLEIYNKATERARQAYQVMKSIRKMEGFQEGPEVYLLPLGTNCRFLMKMDLAEMAYIAELRTTPAGHISYRKVAWRIFQHLAEAAPTLADSIRDRVTDPSQPVDFFKR